MNHDDTVKAAALPPALAGAGRPGPGLTGQALSLTGSLAAALDVSFAAYRSHFTARVRVASRGLRAAGARPIFKFGAAGSQAAGPRGRPCQCRGPPAAFWRLAPLPTEPESLKSRVTVGPSPARARGPGTTRQRHNKSDSERRRSPRPSHGDDVRGNSLRIAAGMEAGERTRSPLGGQGFPSRVPAVTGTRLAAWVAVPRDRTSRPTRPPLRLP